MKNRSRLIKYIIRIIIMAAVSAAIIVLALQIRPEASEDTAFKIKYDLTLWYYDESLTPYLSSFNDDYFKKTGNRTEVVLVPSLEFFDNINKRNIEGTDAPDLYIIDSSKLENAYLSSLAKPNSNEKFNNDNFYSKAMSAAKYKDVTAAYPLCFNIAFMAYNTEMLGEKPESFEKLSASANKDDDTQESGISAFEYDVNNLLYTYFFIGNSIDLGGPAGDDADSFDLSSDLYTASLEYMKSLSNTFPVDPKLIDYRTVEKDFIQEKTAAALFSVRSLTKLYGSGTDFAICKIPDMNEELSSKPLSQTSVICVNPESKKVNDAEDLAEYLSIDNAENIFSSCGLLPCRKGVIEDNKDIDVICDSYENSACLPKLIETENIWDNINTMLYSVWTGEDIERAKNKLNVAVYVALSTRTEQEDK